MSQAGWEHTLIPAVGLAGLYLHEWLKMPPRKSQVHLRTVGQNLQKNALLRTPCLSLQFSKGISNRRLWKTKWAHSLWSWRGAEYRTRWRWARSTALARLPWSGWLWQQRWYNCVSSNLCARGDTSSRMLDPVTGSLSIGITTSVLGQPWADLPWLGRVAVPPVTTGTKALFPASLLGGGVRLCACVYVHACAFNLNSLEVSSHNLSYYFLYWFYRRKVDLGLFPG